MQGSGTRGAMCPQSGQWVCCRKPVTVLPEHEERSALELGAPGWAHAAPNGDRKANKSACYQYQ